jgi:hypothetical protein
LTAIILSILNFWFISFRFLLHVFMCCFPIKNRT